VSRLFELTGQASRAGCDGQQHRDDAAPERGSQHGQGDGQPRQQQRAIEADEASVREPDADRLSERQPRQQSQTKRLAQSDTAGAGGPKLARPPPSAPDMLAFRRTSRHLEAIA